METYQLQDKNNSLSDKTFIRMSPPEAKDSEAVFIVDPLQVMGEKKLLWQERLEEMQKTNPQMTFDEMGWSVADIPDEFTIKGVNNFT